MSRTCGLHRATKSLMEPLGTTWNHCGTIVEPSLNYLELPWDLIWNYLEPPWNHNYLEPPWAFLEWEPCMEPLGTTEPLWNHRGTIVELSRTIDSKGATVSPSGMRTMYGITWKSPRSYSIWNHLETMWNRRESFWNHSGTTWKGRFIDNGCLYSRTLIYWISADCEIYPIYPKSYIYDEISIVL